MWDETRVILSAIPAKNIYKILSSTGFRAKCCHILLKIFFHGNIDPLTRTHWEHFLNQLLIQNLFLKCILYCLVYKDIKKSFIVNHELMPMIYYISKSKLIYIRMWSAWFIPNTFLWLPVINELLIADIMLNS